MKLRTLVFANLLLFGALAVVQTLAAQTPPNPRNCCKTNSEQAKFCCEGCCTSGERCSETSQCQINES